MTAEGMLEPHIKYVLTGSGPSHEPRLNVTCSAVLGCPGMKCGMRSSVENTDVNVLEVRTYMAALKWDRS